VEARRFMFDKSIKLTPISSLGSKSIWIFNTGIRRLFVTGMFGTTGIRGIFGKYRVAVFLVNTLSRYFWLLPKV